MPAPADLVVNNISPTDLTIQTQTIAAGSSFTVPFANIVAWAKDPFLQVYVYSGQVTVNVLGIMYRNQRDILELLEKIAEGNVVFSS